MYGMQALNPKYNDTYKELSKPMTKKDLKKNVFQRHKSRLSSG